LPINSSCSEERAERITARATNVNAVPSPFVELEIGERVIKLTNPDKVLFPKAGKTKRDLVDYYVAVGEGIVRTLYERPTQLRRFPDGIGGEPSGGSGIGVLVNGYWGFAATARQEPEEIDRTARLAVEIAKAAARLPMEPVVLAPIEPVTGTWHSPMQVNPFNIPLEEKVAMLMEATRRMQAIEGLAFAEGGIDLFRRRTFLATSEGSAIEQTTVQSGAGIEGTALGWRSGSAHWATSSG